MNDDADNSRQSSNSSAIAAVVVLLPLLYAFSVGPAIYCMEKFHATASVKAPLRTFYAPLVLLHDHTFLKQPLESYERWWHRLAQGS